MAKKAAKKVTVTLGRFQSVVNRLMEVNEVRDECEKLGLKDGDDVTEYIVSEFERTHDMVEDGDLSDRGYEDEDVIGDEGRIALGYALDDTFTMLAENMGFNTNKQLTEKENAKVQKIFDVFFQE